MTSLKGIIKYEGKSYDDTDATGKEKIEYLAEILEPLEHEILQHEQARILLYASGMLGLPGFPNDLQKKVHELVSG